MRKILFRGFHPDKNGEEKVFVNGEWINGYWVYGDLIHRRIWKSDFLVIREDDSGFDNYTDYEVVPETVGQYTGLKDKNGKKIFENGYIIIDNKTYKVTFNNAEYILTNIFNCDTITLKNNSIRGVFVDEI